MKGEIRFHGHLRGPVTLTSVAERLAVELPIPVLTNLVCSGWDSNQNRPLARRTEEGGGRRGLLFYAKIDMIYEAFKLFC